jgi:hypothetical protein
MYGALMITLILVLSSILGVSGLSPLVGSRLVPGTYDRKEVAPLWMPRRPDGAYTPELVYRANCRNSTDPVRE